MKQQVTGFSWHLLELFRYYKQGHLPFAGGIAEQPYSIMQAFNLIEYRLHKNEEGKK